MQLKVVGWLAGLRIESKEMSDLPQNYETLVTNINIIVKTRNNFLRSNLFFVPYLLNCSSCGDHMTEQVCRSALPCPCDLATLSTIELKSKIGIQARQVTSLLALFFFVGQSATIDVSKRFVLKDQRTYSEASNVRWRIGADNSQVGYYGKIVCTWSFN